MGTFVAAQLEFLEASVFNDVRAFSAPDESLSNDFGLLCRGPRLRTFIIFPNYFIAVIWLILQWNERARRLFKSWSFYVLRPLRHHDEVGIAGQMAIKRGFVAKCWPGRGLIAGPELLIRDPVVTLEDKAHIMRLVKVQVFLRLEFSFHVQSVLASGIGGGPVLTANLPPLVRLGGFRLVKGQIEIHSARICQNYVLDASNHFKYQNNI